MENLTKVGMVKTITELLENERQMKEYLDIKRRDLEEIVMELRTNGSKNLAEIISILDEMEGDMQIITEDFFSIGDYMESNIHWRNIQWNK